MCLDWKLLFGHNLRGSFAAVAGCAGDLVRSVLQKLGIELVHHLHHLSGELLLFGLKLGVGHVVTVITLDPKCFCLRAHDRFELVLANRRRQDLQILPLRKA